MTITLPTDLAKELEAEVAAGRARSVEAFVADAVRAQLARKAELLRSLDEAEADYDQNGGVSWNEIKARIDARLNADD